MKQSDDIQELTKALAKAQGIIEGAKKDGTGKVSATQSYQYSTLASVWDACRAHLSNNGLSVIQGTALSEAGHWVLETRLSHLTGQWVENVTPIYMSQHDMKSLGSAITYARRYALCAMVGIAPEDDDGEASNLPFNPPQAKPVSEKVDDPELSKLRINAYMACKKAGLTTVEDMEGVTGFKGTKTLNAQNCQSVLKSVQSYVDNLKKES